MSAIESSSLPPLETQVWRAARMSFVVAILCEIMIPGHIWHTLYICHGKSPGKSEAWVDEHVDMQLNSFKFSWLPMLLRCHSSRLPVFQSAFGVSIWDANLRIKDMGAHLCSACCSSDDFDLMMWNYLPLKHAWILTESESETCSIPCNAKSTFVSGILWCCWGQLQKPNLDGASGRCWYGAATGCPNWGR